MEIFEALLLAVGLSMDAFAVSVCKGFALPKAGLRQGLRCGLWFGSFQTLMPTAGYLLAMLFAAAIEAIDHWVAFGLLALIGGNMLKEALEPGCDCAEQDGDLGIRTMLVLSLATSIDAMAAGISLAMDGASIWLNAALIGITTCVLSTLGVGLGALVGERFGKKAQLAGGVILILLGLKILLEHLGVL